MKEGIERGDRFICIESCYFFRDKKKPIFIEGKAYESLYDGCITDEEKNTFHSFTKPFWEKYLIRIGDKFDNLIAQRLNEMRIMKKHGYLYDHRTKKYIKEK